MKTQRIVIIGASGYIGSHLVTALAEQGHHIVAASRHPQRPTEPFPNVEYHYLDLYNADTLPPLLHNADIIYYLMHAMGESADFLQRERQAANNLSTALQHCQHSIHSLIYLSSLQPTNDALSSHLRARKETGEILKNSGVPVTELRAGIIIGAGSAAFEVMRDLINALPILTPPSWVRSKSSPIALQNLLYYLTEILAHPSQQHRILDLSGPEVLSYQQMFLRFIKLTNKKRLLLPIPLPAKIISIHWLSMITSVTPTVAKALIEGLKHDLLPDGHPIQQLIPQQLIGYEDAVREALRQEYTALSVGCAADPAAQRLWRDNCSFYPRQAGYRLTTRCNKQEIWQVIQQIGGSEGYFFANSLWSIRAWIDELCGNPCIYGRPSRTALQIGDKIDNWQVIVCQPEQQLTLLFGMKAPGVGRLTFTLHDLEHQQCQLDVRAWWHPAGFRGLLYWFAMMPAHQFIFKGMAKRIVQLASSATLRQQREITK